MKNWILLLLAAQFCLVLANEIDDFENLSTSSEPEEDLLSNQEDSVENAKQKRIFMGSELPYFLVRKIANLAIVRVSGTTNRCTGTLIQPNVIITAAHCFPPGSILSQSYALVGETTTNLYPGQTFRANRYSFLGAWIHPDFDSNEEQNDVALIWLDQPVFTGHGEPVLILNAPSVGSSVYVAGYGSHERGVANYGPEYADMVIVNCDDSGFSYLSEYSHICYTDSLQKTCFGDSGGPIFHYFNGDYYLVGLIRGAEGFTGSCANVVLQYGTRLSTHIDWINGMLSGTATSKWAFQF